MKMLAKARKGHTFCRYGCCRHREFYGHGGRNLSVVRRRQRATEKDALRRELRHE